MSTNPNECLFIGTTPEEAVAWAALQVTKALAGGGKRAVALSGGRTPEKLYAALTQPPYRNALDWNEIEWFWGDERCVPPDHPDSNYRMALHSLLKPLGVAPERIHRMPADAADLDAAAREYEQTIRRVVPPQDHRSSPSERLDHEAAADTPVFDLVLLGIGSDGHTASLFPGSDALAETDRLVVAHRPPTLGAWRLTFTWPLLLAARHILVLANGPEKAAAMAGILNPPGDPTLPAVRLHAAAGRLSWVLDAEAARLVKG